MNHFLLDASALAKRYHPENGLALVNHLFASVSNIRLSCLEGVCNLTPPVVYGCESTKKLPQ